MVMEECCDRIQHKHNIYLPKRRALNWNVCCCLMQGAYDMRGLDDVRDKQPLLILARAVPAHGRSKSEHRCMHRSCK
jgi:hypothetical protein